MTVLGLLIPVSLGLGLVGAAAFIWSVRAEQYDDLEGAAARILDEDDLPPDAREPRGEEPG
ncbi:MAG: cbb3-type cytochrome oxidase assembly protein CcoS [Pseudomonadota bacterium]